MATFPETLVGYDSGTPSNNTPAGSDSVGTQLDDHLRDIKANAKKAGALIPGTTSSVAVTSVLADFNKLLLIDPAAADRTVSVLTASAAGAGFRVGVKNVTGANKVVIVHDTGASGTIDGQSAVTLSATNQAVMLTSNGSTWHTSSSHRINTFTGLTTVVKTYAAGSHTWTKPANLISAIIEVQGGGGGGGGTANPGGDEAGAGAGGGGGGYARKMLLAADLGATESVTVGAVAAGGSSSNGIIGNASTFAVASGTNIVGNGGGGGKSAVGAVGVRVEAGAVGGAATGGDINITGSGTGPAFSMGNASWRATDSNLDSPGTQALAFSSPGGAGFFGGGGGSSSATETTTATGGAGTHGGGGGGSGSGDTGGAVTGGAGGAGLVVVTEFIKVL